MQDYPKVKVILGYKDVYDFPMPENRLSLLNGISKVHLIALLCSINYRLRPKFNPFGDQSNETQNDILKMMCYPDSQLYNYYVIRASGFMVEHNLNSDDPVDYPLIFTRQMCLYSLEEIIQSELQQIENFDAENLEVKNAIMQYIFCINTALTNIEEQKEKPLSALETINAPMLALNELNVDTLLLHIPFRGYRLMRFFSENDEIGTHFNSYFENYYHIDFETYIFRVMSMYAANKNVNELHDFYYYVPEKNDSLFTIFSQLQPTDKVEKLLSIKKYPFYKTAPFTYLLFDMTFLVEKMYQQLINDFWFDYLKNLRGANESNLFSAKRYWSIVGLFLESYLHEIITSIYQDSDEIVLMFDELKLTVKKQPIELADLYIRRDNEIIVGEVKATTIFDKAKYSGNVDQLYSSDRDKFFYSFGIDQIVKHIGRIQKHISSLDEAFDKSVRYDFYPVIIVNEKALQTPFMSQIFQNRFAELLAQTNFENVRIFPLSLIHVSDFERGYKYFKEDSSRLLQSIKKTVVNKRYIAPFYHTLNLDDIKDVYPKAEEFYTEIITKYALSTDSKFEI